MLPTVIVAWLIVLAFFNTQVWVIPDDAEAHNMKITGKQWFWEYEYEDSLTWEDDPSITYIDVDWSGTTLTGPAQPQQRSTSPYRREATLPKHVH